MAAAKGLAILVCLLVAYLGFRVFSARQSAHQLCGSIAMGQDELAARAMLYSHFKEFTYELPGTNKVTAGYMGAYLDMWYCDIQFSDGKVVSTTVRVMY